MVMIIILFSYMEYSNCLITFNKTIPLLKIYNISMKRAVTLLYKTFSLSINSEVKIYLSIRYFQVSLIHFSKKDNANCTRKVFSISALRSAHVFLLIRE